KGPRLPNTTLRLFDAMGNQLALSPASAVVGDPTRLNWTFLQPQTAMAKFYLGVSGDTNTNYDPSVANSGTNSNEGGQYALNLDLSAAFNWIDQGPHSVSGGQVALTSSVTSQTTGAVAAIAAHPTDADTIFVAGVNGGIWKSSNGGITWSPKT